MPFVGLGVGVGRQRFGGGGFDADYQAVLDYATTQGYTLPSAGQQVLQNQLVVDLKAGGIWSKLDTFAVFATDGDSDFALIDWKRLTDYTAVNSPTFAANQGFTGDGVSAYINTNKVAQSGPNYTLNDASRFVVASNSTANITLDGATNSNFWRIPFFGVNAFRINGGNTNINITASGIESFKIINRINNDIYYLDQGSEQIATTTSPIIIINSQFIFHNGVADFGETNVKIYGFGASLRSEQNFLKTITEAYITSI